MTRLLAILLASLLSLPAFGQMAFYGGGYYGGTSFSSASSSTTGPLNLYVTTTGNDANSCSAVYPCLTIQAAANRVPKTIKHPVTLHVGPGTFDGVRLAGFTFEDTTAAGTFIYVKGTLANATLASGLVTGSVASATVGSNSNTTWGTMVVTGAGWTVNDLAGRLVEITSGPGSTAPGALQNPNSIRLVYSNTADTVTILGAWGAGADTPTSASTFAIREWATTVRSTVPPANIPYYAAYLGDSAGLVVEASVGSERTSWRVTVNRILFANASTSDTGIQVMGPVTLSSHWNKFHNLSTAIRGGQGAGVFTNYGNHITAGCYTSISISGVSSNHTNVYSLATGGWVIFDVGLVAFNGSYFKTTSAGAFYTDNAQISTNGSIYDGSGTATACLKANAGQLLTISGSNVSNCITAVQATGATATLTGVGGTGNTTAISVQGGTATINGASTITGSTELLLGTSSFTLAQMRAAVPKVASNLATLSVAKE